MFLALLFVGGYSMNEAFLQDVETRLGELADEEKKEYLREHSEEDS